MKQSGFKSRVFQFTTYMWTRQEHASKNSDIETVPCIRKAAFGPSSRRRYLQPIATMNGQLQQTFGLVLSVQSLWAPPLATQFSVLSKTFVRLCASFWVSLGLSVRLCASLRLSGLLWASPGLSGPLWASLGLSGPLSASLTKTRQHIQTYIHTTYIYTYIQIGKPLFLKGPNSRKKAYKKPLVASSQKVAGCKSNSHIGKPLFC